MLTPFLYLAALFASLFLVIKSADYSIRFSSALARSFRIPTYSVGFFVVAIISILPEAFISITSAFQGVPEFGLGTLFGSNVADLTLVLALVAFATANGIRVSSNILQKNKWYPLLLALPIAVGFDGHYSRLEGLLLVVAGAFFYYWTLRREGNESAEKSGTVKYRHTLYLGLSMLGLLVGSHLIVQYGVAFAESVHLSPILIGMLIVGLGTTLPELMFSIRAVRKRRHELALGDILGTVISDATIVVGLLALINPFSFPQKIVYVTAGFMVAAGALLFVQMRTGKILSKQEAIALVAFYISFVVVEYLVSG